MSKPDSKGDAAETFGRSTARAFYTMFSNPEARPEGFTYAAYRNVIVQTAKDNVFSCFPSTVKVSQVVRDLAGTAAADEWDRIALVGDPDVLISQDKSATSTSQ